ncbi:MAG: acyltransferase 3 [Acidobacteriaceae bacterium]|nr:acyltransferase 3 [Acidobacteriaceae bacterium]
MREVIGIIIKDASAPAGVTDTAKRAEALRYRGYIPGLDVLRGAAILAVLCYHGIAGNLSWLAWQGLPRLLVRVASYGSTGVHLFFVLSGFLITGILIDNREKPRAMRRFYIHRALRILPAYLLMLAVLKLAQVISWRFVLACLLYIANMAKLVGARDSEYGSLWSLAVEEQFYLLWPWVVRRCGLRRLQQISVAVCVATVLLRLSLAIWWPNADRYYKTWDNADYLLYGSLVAIAVRRGTLHRENSRLIRRALLAVGVVGIAVVWHLEQVKLNPTTAAAVNACHLLPFCAVYVSLLLLAMEQNRGQAPRNLAARGLAFLGYISYGLYLVHSFVYALYERFTANTRLMAAPPHFGNELLRGLVGATVSVLIAYLSRISFEEAFLRRKQRWSPQMQAAAKPA